MADTQVKVAVIGLIGLIGAAAFGATQEPWWWCKIAGCSKPDTPPPPMGALLMGTNLQGNDINNGEHVQNVQACLQLCTETSECKAMTYVYPNVNDTQNGTCWLKGEVPPALGNPNMISAKKVDGA